MSWRNPINQLDIETALDNHQLFVAMGYGHPGEPVRFWLLRRNGKTQTWKRSPDRFRIPVKYGLRGYDAIDEHYLLVLLRIAESRAAAEEIAS